jgi:HlyD family secretion protein
VNRYLIPSLSVGVGALLVGGVVSALLASDLSAANEADRAAAGAEISSTLDLRGSLPPSGSIGGAGVLEPKSRPVSLAASAGGVVDRVVAGERERVAAGAVLVTLRADTARADLAAATADLAAARADLQAAQADSDAANARATSSTASAQRTEALFAKAVTTADERDRAVRERDADQGSARAAGARAVQARARVEAAAARVAQAEARLAELEIRAPSAGEVLQVFVLPGEFLPAGGAAAVIGDTSELRARIDIDERDAGQIELGDPALVRIEGRPDAVRGTVVEVGRRVGRKNVRTDDPTERQDARFVEVVVALEGAPPAAIGTRVEGYIGG